MRMKIYLSSFVLVGLLMLSAGAPASYALQLGGREAPDWIDRLERPERLAGLKVEEVVQRLALKPGMVIADIGAGTGYFSARLANMLSRGRVYAVDIEPDMVRYLGERAQREKSPPLKGDLGGCWSREQF